MWYNFYSSSMLSDVPVQQQCIVSHSSNTGKALFVDRVDHYNNLKELQIFLVFLSTLHQVWEWLLFLHKQTEHTTCVCTHHPPNQIWFSPSCPTDSIPLQKKMCITNKQWKKKCVFNTMPQTQFHSHITFYIILVRVGFDKLTSIRKPVFSHFKSSLPFMVYDSNFGGSANVNFVHLHRRRNKNARLTYMIEFTKYNSTRNYFIDNIYSLQTRML